MCFRLHVRRETPILLGPLEKANLNHWTSHVLVSGLYTLYHNFYCIFSSHFPSTKPGLRYSYNCSCTDMGCTAFRIPEDGQSPKTQ
jgi:hypothetical protein